MITLTAKINLISGGNLTGVSELQGNNISSSIPLGSKKAVKNPFIIGASRLGDGSTFSGGVDYFIGSQLANKSGVFEQPYEIVVSGSNISSITIAFDDNKGRHPNSITIDGVTYYDDDAIYTITGLDPTKQKHTLVISDWSEPKYPIVISGIYSEVTIDVDRKTMLSMETNSSDRDGVATPSFGLISNGGSMQFKDLNGELYDYAEQQLLSNGVLVDIYLFDTIHKNRELVGSFYSSDWDYDSDNRSVYLKYKDDLEELQEIIFDRIDYDFDKMAEKTLRWFYEKLFSATPQKYGFPEFENLDEKTKIHLENTKIKYPYLERVSLWGAWEKLCVVGMLHIYKEKGNTICKYNGGN